jgi:hypothetical protein
MDHNNPLQNYNNNLQSSPVLYNNNDTSCIYFSATDNDIIPNYEQQQSIFPSATQPLSYTPQYTAHERLHESRNISSPPNVTANSSSRPNYSEFFFEIPGFKIVITCIPTTSTFTNLNNLDMQNQFQQNIVVDNSQDCHNSSSFFTDNSQTRFQQDYNSSNIVIGNSQTSQFQQDFNSSNIVNNNNC